MVDNRKKKDKNSMLVTEFDIVRHCEHDNIDGSIRPLFSCRQMIAVKDRKPTIFRHPSKGAFSPFPFDKNDSVWGF